MGGHWEPISFLVQILDFLDLNWLVIGSAPSKKSRSDPEVFRAGHNRDMTDTGNRARKTSGTQGKLMVEAAILANGGLLKMKVDCTNFRLVYHLYITGCWVLQEGNVMTITVECPLVISGKSLFVKILVHLLLITVQTYISYLQHPQKLRSGILFCV